jgi:hypothetical protein
MSLPATTVPFLAATAALGLAGVAKLARPDDTARALAAAHLPHHRRLVRVGAVGEVAVAVAAVAVPGPVTGALVAVAYAAFGVFVVMALRRGWPLSSCGCFARPDARPSWQHAVLNGGASLAAAWWAAGAPARIARLFTASPWHGAPLLLESVVVAGLALLVWTNPMFKAVR